MKYDKVTASSVVRRRQPSPTRPQRCEGGGAVGGRVGGVGGAFSPLIRGAEKGDRLSDRQAARTQL